MIKTLLTCTSVSYIQDCTPDSRKSDAGNSQNHGQSNQIEVLPAEATIEAIAQGIASMLCAHGPEVELRICAHSIFLESCASVELGVMKLINRNKKLRDEKSYVWLYIEIRSSSV